MKNRIDELREHRNIDHRHGIDRLVAREMAYARAAYGDTYHSAHEGFAVIREEVLEAEEEIESIKRLLDVLDHRIRSKVVFAGMYRDADYISATAVDLAIEALHIAAAAEKFTRSFADTNAPQA